MPDPIYTYQHKQIEYAEMSGLSPWGMKSAEPLSVEWTNGPPGRYPCRPVKIACQ